MDEVRGGQAYLFLQCELEDNEKQAEEDDEIQREMLDGMGAAILLESRAPKKLETRLENGGFALPFALQVLPGQLVPPVLHLLHYFPCGP